jgi:hypothetical protein
MRNFAEISKGLGGFVYLWDTKANEDIWNKFRRRNKPLSYYWKAMKSILILPLFVCNTLQIGFWLSSTFAFVFEDQFLEDSIVWEEYAKDASFVGKKSDRPAPSFQISCSVFIGYFLAMYSKDGDMFAF